MTTSILKSSALAELEKTLFGRTLFVLQMPLCDIDSVAKSCVATAVLESIVAEIEALVPRESSRDKMEHTLPTIFLQTMRFHSYN